MKKVVINTCYGGFGLSPKAVKRYYELVHPEVTLYFYNEEYGDNFEQIFTKVENPTSNTITLTKDFGDSFVIKNFKDAPYTNDEYVWLDGEVNRTDPALIQVVEELGEEANGDDAELAIEEVYDKYRICEYDGKEWIETPESIIWND